MQFSLEFDPAVLAVEEVTQGSAIGAGAIFVVNRTQANKGRVGVLMAFEPGKTFEAGRQELLGLRFKIVSGNTLPSARIEFSDLPVSRLVGNASATALPALYEAGVVTLPLNYEGDVTPSPDGDGEVNVLDVQRTARLAALIETPATRLEFQRADTSPRADKGDGKLNLFDVQQTARYAAGLDERVVVGGPIEASQLLPGALTAVAAPNETRKLRLGPATLLRGQTGTLRVWLDAAGNENGASFSLTFDPARLRFAGAKLEQEARGAMLLVNDAQASRGRLGFLLALPAGQAFAPGAHAVLVLNFLPLAGQPGAAVETALSFGDEPVARSVGDLNAQPLPAGFDGAMLRLADAPVANVSAASFGGDSLAPDAITVAFGAGLAKQVEVASGLPLPTSLGGTMVLVRDSAGIERAAGLFFVSPNQINYHLPPETAPGRAQITILTSDNRALTGEAEIAPVAPGLFTASGNGQGVAAGIALRRRADGTISYEPLAKFEQSQFVAVPIDLSREDEDVYLILYGTGLRGRSDLKNVRCSIGGVEAEVSYAGEVAGYAGMDQLNVKLPRALAGRGEVDLLLRVDGRAANTLRVGIR
ncbi:MAG TPA: hypothetical protein PKC13_28765 [Blastocatellia bacterium]|nr:hypothetical protein [Blastocatellia bacterium]